MRNNLLQVVADDVDSDLSVDIVAYVSFSSV